METLEAIVLGIVQGLTEFLPISSSAHLRIVPAFAGWQDPGAAFTAVIQLGTMAAVLLYFRRDLWDMARALAAGARDPAARRTIDFRLGVYIVLGTIPISVFGLAFADTIENEFRALTLVGAMLIVAGLVLAWSERFRPSRPRRGIEGISRTDAIVIGFAQAAALVPGVSRSGASIIGGMASGLDRRTATIFSFYLAIPTLGGATGLELIGALRTLTPSEAGYIVVGTLVTLIVSWFSIGWLLRYISTHSFVPFAIYRIVLGLVVLALVAGGRL